MKKTINMLQSDIDALQEKKRILNHRAAEDDRALTSSESELIRDIENHVGELQDQINRIPNAPLSRPGSHLGGDTPSAAGRKLVGPRGKKDYAALFGNGGTQWDDKQTSFFQAVFSGRHHPGLMNMNSTVPSEGGFLIPNEYAQQIHNVSLESELVMPRAFVQPMTSNEIKIPGTEISDHSVALMGGFTASYTSEGGTINVANPAVRSMSLIAKKLTGMLRFTSELLADAPGGEEQIINLCGAGLSWYRDKAFLRGTGAGQPLGILNSDALIVVDKEIGQDASTILFENLTAMMSRMFAGSFNRSVWVAHQSCIPALMGLAVHVGVGGSYIPAMRETDGTFSILTRPVIFTEKMNPIGDEGDIMLADFSQYVCGLRSGMRFDTSIHAHFSTDEVLARLIERHDGMPLWDGPLTLMDGATTVSPFVVLEARA